MCNFGHMILSNKVLYERDESVQYFIYDIGVDTKLDSGIWELLAQLVCNC